jgi:hypothetical protein
LHRLGDIPSHEAIIVLIAVGHLRDDFKVAASPRAPVQQILRVHKESE